MFLLCKGVKTDTVLHFEDVEVFKNKLHISSQNGTKTWHFSFRSASAPSFNHVRLVATPWTVACPWDFPGRNTGVVPTSFSRRSSQPNQTQVSCVCCIVGGVFTTEPLRKPSVGVEFSINNLLKARDFQKTIYFCFIDCAKAFDCVDHNKLENSERDGNTRPPDLPLEKSVCRSGSNS